MRKLPYLLLLICYFSSCSKEYTPSPQQEKDVPVILGEITPNKPIDIILTNAKNITSPNYVSSEKFSNVVLLDSNENNLDTLTFQENNYWKSNYKVQPNENYTLQFQYKNNKINAKTKIPSSFYAEILEQETLSNDTLLLKLTIEDVSDDSFYVVECWQYANNNYSKLSFLNNDKFTDNNKYHELYSPYKRLFFKTSIPRQITLKIITDPYSISSEDKFIEIRVKNVNYNYYEYLYNYEHQLQDEEFYLPNNNKYLGVLGGSYNIILKTNYLHDTTPQITDIIPIKRMPTTL